MARRHYNLPPLTTLAAFEAAARHLSFKSAAQELNVTPGAVSHQVKALEGELGISLFLRRHRGVDLTSAGVVLSQVLAQSFTQTAAVLERLRVEQGPQSVTIGASTAVTMLWLMPRISAFWRDHPDILVNQRTSDVVGDLNRPGIDLRIQYDLDPDAVDNRALLFRDRIMPVCAPGYLSDREQPDLEELASLPLIHLDGVDVKWTSWRDWFDAQNYNGPIRRAISVNNYTIALEVARDGKGIALGWERLVAPLLESGQLEVCSKAQLPSPGGIYLTWSDEELLSAPARTLRDWLIASA
ncbi:LysR substrate-binding domain-containing protein [Rhodovibrionaceae bacterium A322]